MTFGLAFAARLLELPFWQDPAYQLDGERLLATHDAYHWIAGAEGFEFGAGHPMSEMVRVLAGLFGVSPANLGFWLPLFMGAAVAVAVYVWAACIGFPHAGICAGVLTSLSPSFFARTLLGFCDTDLVNLLFVILLGLVPTVWLLPWLTSIRDMIKERLRQKRLASPETPAPEAPSDAETDDFSPGLFTTVPDRRNMRAAMLSWPWLLALILAGLFGHWTTGWHSMFPYMIRFSALLWPMLIIFFGPRGGRLFLLQGAACHALVLIYGLPGMVGALIYSSLLTLHRAKTPSPAAAALDKTAAFCRGSLILACLWLVVLGGVVDLSVFQNLIRSFFAYTKSSNATGAAKALQSPPVFPGVAQSIIEVQDLDLGILLVYFYPYIPITLIALASFAVLLFFSPALIWFVPLLGLSLLSVKLGGRMTMFGAPPLMLALSMAGGLLFRRVTAFSSYESNWIRDKERNRRVGNFLASLGNSPARLALAVLFTFILAWPLITPLPRYTQGPIISREHAEGLRYLKENSPPTAVIWNWWDWGYATHHFALRRTIADGARHGGPSLYLPAAVYATPNPRFARQLIKHAATRNSIPGDVFEGLTAAQTQALITDLAKEDTPLVKAEGKQYLVVSFDLLRLGLWVNRYGHWNFLTRQGGTALMNNVNQRLEFNMDTGVVVPAEGEPLTAKSIDYFSPAGLLRKEYHRPNDFHFIFNIQRPLKETAERPLGPGALFWKWQKGSFSYAQVVSDKLVVDDVFYNSIMVQLLLCKPDDARFKPYFKLVFDNTYCRIFEVL